MAGGQGVVLDDNEGEMFREESQLSKGMLLQDTGRRVLQYVRSALLIVQTVVGECRIGAKAPLVKIFLFYIIFSMCSKLCDENFGGGFILCF